MGSKPSNLPRVYRRHFRGLFFALILSGATVLPAKEVPWVGGYSSRDAGSEQEPAGTQVYPMHRLETLRRAVAPRYVQILDWKQYGQTQKIVNAGVLFTYADYQAERVMVAGNFSNWQPIAMRRNKKGVYYYVLPIREIEGGVRFNSRDYVYRYKFLADGIWTHDPANKNRIDDGLGAYASEFRPVGEAVPRVITVRVLREARAGQERLVEFAIYLPETKNLALVGTFNRWNPEHDLPLKGEDGVFRLRLRLKPGEYAYKYIADGRWILDSFNPQTRFFAQIGELCSHIKIE